MTKEPLIGFNFQMPESRWKFLKQESMETRKPMGRILIEYIEAQIKKREKKELTGKETNV